jgi:hypothetical protein
MFDLNKCLIFKIEKSEIEEVRKDWKTIFSKRNYFLKKITGRKI